MYIYPKKSVPVAHKIVSLPKSRFERLKDELIEIKQSGIVVFGAYSYFAGYFSDFWTSLNPLYR